jgi:DNA repair protein RadD
MSDYEDRPYQTQALEALESYWTDGGGNPLVALPTGTGKSLVIARLITTICERYPGFRPLILTHRQELIKHTYDHLITLWPLAPAELNCAGLGRRDIETQILFASIASVFRNPSAMGERDLTIVDEAHLIPCHAGSMYRRLFAKLLESVPSMRVAGFSATCFRMDVGRLDEGEDRIFDTIVFDYSLARAIKDGYLAPLVSKGTDTKIDVGGVHIRGGEFIEHELERVVDTENIVGGAVTEITEQGQDRRSWLIFCVGVTHAIHVRDELRARGISAEVITGKTPQDERERTLGEFKAGKIRALTNVNVLTTGFDAPNVDLLAMLRPTLSTGLYVQMVGRGTRKAPNKVDCLILDFAGNVRRHGPVDTIDASTIIGKGVTEPDTERAWQCPECKGLNSLGVHTCKYCGYEKPKQDPEPKHATKADAVPVLSGDQHWHRVTHAALYSQTKRNDPLAPPSLRVTYTCGLSSYSEYISLQRQGWARTLAEKWWCAMGGLVPVPLSVAEAIERRGEVARPIELTIFRNGQFWNIADRRVRRVDGTVVEIDRWFNCWVVESRQAAFETLRNEPFEDEVPY